MRIIRAKDYKDMSRKAAHMSSWSSGTKRAIWILRM